MKFPTDTERWWRRNEPPERNRLELHDRLLVHLRDHGPSTREEIGSLLTHYQDRSPVDELTVDALLQALHLDGFVEIVFERQRPKAKRPLKYRLAAAVTF